MFTIRAVEDDQLTIGSEDSGDIARVFRLIRYDLPVDRSIRITAVFVTIYKETLTAGDSHAKITSSQHEPHQGDPELPF